MCTKGADCVYHDAFFNLESRKLAELVKIVNFNQNMYVEVLGPYLIDLQNLIQKSKLGFKTFFVLYVSSIMIKK